MLNEIIYSTANAPEAEKPDSEVSKYLSSSQVITASYDFTSNLDFVYKDFKAPAFTERKKPLARNAFKMPPGHPNMESERRSAGYVIHKSTQRKSASDAMLLTGNQNFGANASPSHQPSSTMTASTATDYNSYKTLIIRRNFEHMVSTNIGNTFEDGVENDISAGVFRLIKFYGAQTISIAKEYIFSNNNDPEVCAEIVKWMALNKDGESHNERCNLIYDSLFHRSPIIRDAAIIGMFSLNNADALKAIKMAKISESIPSLKCDLDQLDRELSSRIHAKVFQVS